MGFPRQVGCHFLLQGIVPTQSSNLLDRQILYHWAPWEAHLTASRSLISSVLRTFFGLGLCPSVTLVFSLSFSFFFLILTMSGLHIFFFFFFFAVYSFKEYMELFEKDSVYTLCANTASPLFFFFFFIWCFILNGQHNFWGIFSFMDLCEGNVCICIFYPIVMNQIFVFCS